MPYYDPANGEAVINIRDVVEQIARCSLTREYSRLVNDLYIYGVHTWTIDDRGFHIFPPLLARLEKIEKAIETINTHLGIEEKEHEHQDSSEC